jgi:DNA topoisomerase VI subunit B
MAKEPKRGKETSSKPRLAVVTGSRGEVSEREAKKPRAPRPKANPGTEMAKQKQKPAEDQLPLSLLVAKEVHEEEDAPSRLGGRLKAERASAPSVGPIVAEDSPSRRKTAETMAGKQRDISVSEFFAKNRHLLGFDNPAKSLLTAIKEAVDNSLDACEEAGILPNIAVSIEEVGTDRYRVAVEDNGPGIVKQQIPKIFGKLLYGSKFHSMKQSRGQQGIGISAAGMYGQLTTGKPVAIISRAGEKAQAIYCELHIDTRTNKPEVLKEKIVEWRPGPGTRVEIELAGIYKKGRHSVDSYLQQTAIANPHAELSYLAPRSTEWVIWKRGAEQLPKEPVEIKPHPHGIELGFLIRMLKETEQKTVSLALQTDFSRVTDKLASEICEKAKISPNAKPQKVATLEAEALYKAMQEVKIMAPPTNCISPIGEELIRRGLESGVEGAEFYAATTRPPAVYRGIPFQIEVGIAYGGKLPGDEPCDLYRFANRVPLLYQQSACGVTKAVMGAGWRNYGLSQPKGALPLGPLVLIVHIASVWVPFTSESKEAIAHYPEILREMRLAIQECGRKLGAHIRKLKRFSSENKKRTYIEKYIPIIGEALQEILKLSEKQEKELIETLGHTLEKDRRKMMPASMRKAEDEEAAASAEAGQDEEIIDDEPSFKMVGGE